MKRFLSLFLVGIGAFLLFNSSAKAYEVVWNTIDITESKDGTKTSVVEFMVKGNKNPLSSVIIELVTDPGIVIKDVKGAGNWNAQKTAKGVTFFYNDVNSTGEDTPEFTMGTVTLFYPKENLENNQCNVGIKVEEANSGSITLPEDTPDTGASLPIIALFSGIALAGAAYYVTRKNTKMYNV